MPAEITVPGARSALLSDIGPTGASDRGRTARGASKTTYRALLPCARHNATSPPELCLGSVSRSLGTLAATMSDWDAAARRCEGSLAMNADRDARPWLAGRQHDYAGMLLAPMASGDPERAR